MITVMRVKADPREHFRALLSPVLRSYSALASLRVFNDRYAFRTHVSRIQRLTVHSIHGEARDFRHRYPWIGGKKRDLHPALSRELYLLHRGHRGWGFIAEHGADCYCSCLSGDVLGEERRVFRKREMRSGREEEKETGMSNKRHSKTEARHMN